MLKSPRKYSSPSQDLFSIRVWITNNTLSIELTSKVLFTPIKSLSDASMDHK